MGEWRVGGWVVTVGGVFRELAAEFVPAERLRRRPFKAISGPLGSLRLAAQDVALSRRKRGFESPRERQNQKLFNDFSYLMVGPVPLDN